MQLFKPGDHGTTFGGYPLASAVGLEALNVLIEEDLVKRSKDLGEYLLLKLQTIKSPLIKAIRGKGLFIGIEIDPQKAVARDLCLQLMAQGLLSKETHETVIRLAPPLIITQQQLDDAIEIINKVFENSLGCELH
jgi:ornithine--oxo-acid transaminase